MHRIHTGSCFQTISRAIAAAVHMPAQHQKEIGVVLQGVVEILGCRGLPGVIHIENIVLGNNAAPARVSFQEGIRPIPMFRSGIVLQVDDDKIHTGGAEQRIVVEVVAVVSAAVPGLAGKAGGSEIIRVIGSSTRKAAVIVIAGANAVGNACRIQNIHSRICSLPFCFVISGHDNITDMRGKRNVEFGLFGNYILRHCIENYSLRRRIHMALCVGVDKDREVLTTACAHRTAIERNAHRVRFRIRHRDFQGKWNGYAGGIVGGLRQRHFRRGTDGYAADRNVSRRRVLADVGDIAAGGSRRGAEETHVDGRGGHGPLAVRGEAHGRPKAAPAHGRDLEIGGRGDDEVAGQVKAQNRVGLLVRGHADRAGEGVERSRNRDVGRGGRRTVGNGEFGPVGDRAAFLSGKVQAIVFFAGVNHEAHVTDGRVDPVLKHGFAGIVKSDLV